MPDIEMRHIVRHLIDIGINDTDWPTLNAYNQCVGGLTVWELIAVNRMGSAYSGSVAQYTDNDLPAPFIGDIDRDAVADQVRAALRS